MKSFTYISNKLNSMEIPNSLSNGLARDILTLQKEIERCNLIIQEQDKMLQKMKAGTLVFDANGVLSIEYASENVISEKLESILKSLNSVKLVVEANRLLARIPKWIRKIFSAV